MPPEARKPVALITVVAVLGLLLQIIGAAVLYGGTVGELKAGKADRAELKAISDRLASCATVADLRAAEIEARIDRDAIEDGIQEHVTKQAHFEGELAGELRAIRGELVEIRRRLP